MDGRAALDPAKDVVEGADEAELGHDRLGVPLAAGAAGPVTAAGLWRNAVEVPGLGALNAGGSAFVSSVSCASAGKCATGGDYADGSAHAQAFVVARMSLPPRLRTVKEPEDPLAAERRFPAATTCLLAGASPSPGSAGYARHGRRCWQHLS